MTEAAILKAENAMLEALNEHGELYFWEFRDACAAVSSLTDEELVAVLQHAVDTDKMGTLWAEEGVVFISLV